jgi:hypothetical protein
MLKCATSAFDMTTALAGIPRGWIPFIAVWFTLFKRKIRILGYELASVGRTHVHIFSIFFHEVFMKFGIFACFKSDDLEDSKTSIGTNQN